VRRRGKGGEAKGLSKVSIEARGGAASVDKSLKLCPIDGDGEEAQRLVFGRLQLRADRVAFLLMGFQAVDAEIPEDVINDTGDGGVRVGLVGGPVSVAQDVTKFAKILICSGAAEIRFRFQLAVQLILGDGPDGGPPVGFYFDPSELLGLFGEGDRVGVSK
jgi:hypothetical protein